MKLVFIHGWAFDPTFWSPLASRLPEHEHEFVNLGYFGGVANFNPQPNSILVGHSLGFVHGIKMSSDWAGLISVNSFSKFVKDDAGVGCVPAASLRKLQKDLRQNPDQALSNFYSMIGTKKTPEAAPDFVQLQNGLEELQTADIGQQLSNSRAPRLVLASINDPLVPVAASEYLGDVKWHATGGHILPQSDPAWCAKQMTEFIKTNFRQAA